MLLMDLLLLLLDWWRVSIVNSVIKIWPRMRFITMTITRAFRVLVWFVDDVRSPAFIERICIVWGVILTVVKRTEHCKQYEERSDEYCEAVARER